MKKPIELLAFAFVLMLSACDNADDNPNVEGLAQIELKNFSNTGCKSSFERTRSEESVWKEVFKYSSIHDGYLYVTHQDAYFNCCAGELYSEVKAEGNQITVSEWEKESLCDCICPYDLSYEIGPLVEGKTYVIHIGHKGAEMKVAEFTFHNAMSGIWEVNRNE